MAEENTKTMRRYVGTKETLIYGIANGGQVLSISLATSYITYFFVNVFHIKATYVSAMMFVEGIWDTLNDLLMGAVVDKTRTRYGKLRPYLLGVPLPTAVITILMLGGPLWLRVASDSAPSKIIYMTLTYFIWEFFYTVGDVPFWGLSAAVSPNPDDRTRAITSARLISSVIGSIPSIILPIVMDISTSPGSTIDIKRVFFLVGLAAAVVGMGLFSLTGIFVKERVVHSADEPSFRDCMNHIFKNPPLRLIIYKEIITAFSGISGVFETYYYIDVLNFASASIFKMVPIAITGLVSFLLVPFAKKHGNNRQIIILEALLTAGTNLLVYLVGLGSYTKLGVILPLLMLNFSVFGLLGGIKSVVSTEMIGETVDYMEWQTGQRNEGVSFAVLTFIGKLSGSLSRSGAAALLPLIGYRTDAAKAIVPQTAATKSAIWFIFMAMPVIFRALGTIPMFFYDLVGEKRQKMFDDLVERREQLAKEVSQ